MMQVIGADGVERLEPDNYIIQDRERCRIPVWMVDHARDSGMSESEKAYREMVEATRNAWRDKTLIDRSRNR